MKNEPIIINNKPLDTNERQQNKRGTEKNDKIIEMKIKRRRRKSKTRFSIKEDNKSRNLMLLNNNQNNSSVNINNINNNDNINNNNNNNVSDKNIKMENDIKVNIYDSKLINIFKIKNKLLDFNFCYFD